MGKFLPKITIFGAAATF